MILFEIFEKFDVNLQHFYQLYTLFSNDIILSDRQNKFWFRTMN